MISTSQQNHISTTRSGRNRTLVVHLGHEAQATTAKGEAYSGVAVEIVAFECVDIA